MRTSLVSLVSPGSQLRLSRNATLGALVFAGCAGLALGCAHTADSKKTTTPVAEKKSDAPANGSATASTGDKTCNADIDCGDKQLCIRNRCVDITADLAECSLLRVHFDLDGSNIADGDRPNLNRMARCLKADHVLHVAIEGNADERGTDEYNMALGDKRATSVAKYLESVGVSQTQLKTVSYGKEKPLCAEHDEDCWAKNRRAAVRPQANR